MALDNEKKLSDLFDNNTDCYADTWKIKNYAIFDGITEGDVIPAITKENFVSIISQFIEQKTVSEEDLNKILQKEYPIVADSIDRSEKRGFIKGFKVALQHTQQSQWISVEDRLPEIGQNFNAVIDNWKIVYECGAYVGSWTKEEMLKTFRVKQITHWMPLLSLPQPPKQ